MTDVPIYLSINAAESASIAAAVKAVRTQYRAPTYDVIATLVGGADYARISLADIPDSYPAAAYFRSTDRYMPDGTTDDTNGGYWLNVSQVLRPEMFGLFTDATVTKTTLLAAMQFATVTRRLLAWKGGQFNIDGPITPTTGVNGAELHLQLEGDVRLSVVGTTPFVRVIYFESETVTNHSIGGNGTLSIDCNDLAACGLWLRHTAVGKGGSVILDNPVKVSNVKGGSTDNTAGGIVILGRFERIIMRSPEVYRVDRAKADAESSGISISGFEGTVEIYSPIVQRVLSGAGTVDADGIKCFGFQPGTAPGNAYNRRAGSVRIYDAIFEDCQGRSYKDQCGDTVLYRPIVRRRASVLLSDPNSIEFDFQFGNGLVLNPWIEYYLTKVEKDGKFEDVSPLSGSHSVVVFQQVLDDAVMNGAIRNATILSDVVVPRYALQVTGATAMASNTEVDGLTLIPANGLATTMIERCILEFDGDDVEAKAAETILSVTNVSGPMNCSVIGYTGYTGRTDLKSGNLSTKLTVAVDRCSTSLAATNGTRAIENLSGMQIAGRAPDPLNPTWPVYPAFKSFEIGDNPGFRNWYSGWSFIPKKLRAGTKLVLDLATTTFLDANGTAAIAVPWGTSGALFLECKGLSNFATTSLDTVCEARLNNATASPSAWFTQDGGANWGELN